METVIGKVTHYYPRIGVAAVVLSDHIARGDDIHIWGRMTICTRLGHR